MFKKDVLKINTYQCRIKALKEQLEAFRNGSAVKKLRDSYERLLAEKDRIIQQKDAELSRAHSKIVSIRDMWFEVFEDLQKEFCAQMASMLKEIARLEKRILVVERQRDEAKDRLHDMTQKYYAVATELEEEKEKNRKLTAQVNRDFENSSIPSSMQISRKKIPNSRKRTGRHPGGQPGHKGHPRKKHTPTERHEIPAPEKYAQNPAFRETGRVVCKQKIEVSIECKVIEYYTKEYLHIASGHTVHAPFPEGYVNEVNYGGSVKALAFLLANECCVSQAKVRQFIKELSHGELVLSDGMIGELCEEFSSKSIQEQKQIYGTLMGCPVMNVDFTNANVNGTSAQVLICTAPETTASLFIAREKKGHAGIQGTIVEDYSGVIVHDHDSTYYRYGQGHQECFQHNLRYLIGSRQNEPDYTWNTQMHKLFQEMLHYQKQALLAGEMDSSVVAGYEERYDEILRTAEKEYEDDPPGDYYPEGYNLYRRLEKYKESELRFLHDLRVPPDKSICERLARVYKRKQKQAMVMRDYDHFDYLCQSLSVVYSLRPNSENLFEQVAEIFERKRIRPKKKKDKKVKEKAEPA